MTAVGRQRLERNRLKEEESELAQDAATIGSLTTLLCGWVGVDQKPLGWRCCGLGGSCGAFNVGEAPGTRRR